MQEIISIEVSTQGDMIRFHFVATGNFMYCKCKWPYLVGCGACKHCLMVDEEPEVEIKKKKKSTQHTLEKGYEAGDPKTS